MADGPHTVAVEGDPRRGVLSGLSQPKWGTQEGAFRGERHGYCPDWRWALSGSSRTCITKVSKDWPGAVDRDHPPIRGAWGLTVVWNWYRGVCTSVS